MKKSFLFLLFIVILASCVKPKQKIDLLIFGPTIYTMDKDSSIFTAMAVDKGKIVELGNEKDLSKKYRSDSIVKLPGKFIYPGFIDAHSHFYELGKTLEGVGSEMVMLDLKGVKSEDNMIKIVGQNAPPPGNLGPTFIVSVIEGRGWDQNIWENKKYPTNKKLNEICPNFPVCLVRIDGHAALVNQFALDLAGINENSKIMGGEFIKENGKLTGVLIDNAVDLVKAKLPKPTKDEMKRAILKAQEFCLNYGLTTVCDAGIDKDLIDLYDEMHKSGALKIRIYAMANPTQPTLGWLLENGPLKTERLHVRSVKYYMDGAMGSRGACLLEDYSDQPGHKGFLLNPIDSLKALAVLIRDKKLQLNVHCIGDSANRVTLKVMAEVLGNDSTSRWRIEHMQLISEEDLKYLKKYKIIPSMQPTHAWSDGPWVGERIGWERYKLAYALNTCLQKSGIIALGTDFPVEEVNPFATFWAAIIQMTYSSEMEDANNIPPATKMINIKLENLTRYQALQGMTIWAAYAQFEENEKGSLEKGKLADFIVMDKDLFKVPENDITVLSPYLVYLNGELVFKRPEIKKLPVPSSGAN